MKILIETGRFPGKLKTLEFHTDVKVIIPVHLLEEYSPDGKGELHVNFTHEGMICDVVVNGQSIGTSSEMYDDAADRLIEDSHFADDPDPPEHSCDACGKNVENGSGYYDGDDRVCGDCAVLRGVRCKKCGSQLNDYKQCTDQTCPYSSRKQHETYTEG